MSIPGLAAIIKNASTDVLKEIAASVPDSSGGFDELLSLLRSSDPAILGGVTWILYSCAKAGTWSPNSSQTRRFLEILLKPSPWATQLHVLQSIPFLTISRPLALRLYEPLLLLVENSNAFIRAWALNSLAEIRPAASEKAAAITSKLKAALSDSSAAVRARVRAALGPRKTRRK